MCGRYQLKDPNAASDLARELFGVTITTAARWNVAPTQAVPVIASGESGQAYVEAMRWGLVPFWDKSEKPSIMPINARSEDALAKTMFRQPLQKRRCLVPADGFYEWKKLPDSRVKQPYSIQLIGNRPFYFAGIYEGPTDRHPPTFAILTTRPNPLMAPIHDRMPIILDQGEARDWIRPGPLTPTDMIVRAEPYPPDWMMAIPVSTLVNNVRNDGPELVRAAGREDLE